MIRLPAAVEQQERKIAAAQARLTRELGREPTTEEIASATGLGPAQVLEIATLRGWSRVSIDRWERRMRRRSAR